MTDVETSFEDRAADLAERLKAKLWRMDDPDGRDLCHDVIRALADGEKAAVERDAMRPTVDAAVTFNHCGCEAPPNARHWYECEHYEALVFAADKFEGWRNAN